MTAKIPNVGPITQAAQQLQLRERVPGADLWRTPGINSNAGSSGQGGEGFLSRVARAMHDGKSAEIAAKRQGGGRGVGYSQAPGGVSGSAERPQPADDDPLAMYRQPAEADPYSPAMAGILARMGGMVPTEAPDLKNTPRRQLRALGLGMIANSGTGMAGIGRAGLDVMAQNDAARAAEIEQRQANREAQRDHLGAWYDHLQGERDYATERADTRADRTLEQQKLAQKAPYQQARTEATQALAEKRRREAARGSATEQEINDLIARGVPPGWAQDVARGNVKTESDPFGNIRAVNLATGEVRNLSAGRQVGAGPGASGGQTQGHVGQRGHNSGVFGAIEEGTGPFSGLRAAWNATVGPLLEGTPNEETAEARAAVRNFSQVAKQALVNSERFPVYEQKLVANLLPDADRFWTDPDSERAKLRELHSFLQERINQNLASMRSGQVTEKERGDLSNQNESIRRILGLMGDPDQAGGEQLPEGVPQGSQKIGTLDGQPVFETPDGRRLVAE